MPTIATLPVSCSTSQSCAMRCIQVAVIATTLAPAKMRKFGTARAAKLSRQELGPSFGSWIGSVTVLISPRSYGHRSYYGG